MSGFEIAGVVLGALPIVIGALSACKEGKGMWGSLLKTRGLLDDLIHRLKTQKTNFYLDILELLREAKVPEVIEEGDPTEERCIEILQDAKTGMRVQEYLGHIYGHFIETLEYYEKFLKSLTSKLENICPRPNDASKDDLVAIIHASKSTNVFRALKSRVGFAIDRKSLNELLEGLSTETYDLGKIIGKVKSKREWETREPRSSSTTLTRAFSRVKESATLLYQAACKCWACDRHGLHNVMLRLDHRIPPDSDQIARPVLIPFELCFPIERTVLQEIRVTTRCLQLAQTAAAVSSQRRSTVGGRLEVPTITITKASHESNLTTPRIQVDSICNIAQKARSKGSVLVLELAAETLELLEEQGTPEYSCSSYNASITLADFLRDTAQDEDAQMKPMRQTLLALSVVSSVLQLRPTVWCNTPLESRSIKFPTKGTDGASVATCIPYVEQTVDVKLLQGHTCSTDLNTEEVKATMLELAILLLEILNHKSIETWAAKNMEGSTQTYSNRMHVAKEWLDWSQEKLLPPHIEVITECLNLCARSKLAWDDRFERVYCENIIRPLTDLALPSS